MSKNTNLSFLTDFLTADIVNSRVGMNNVSPQATFDVTGTGKFSGILTLGSTVSNGTYTYTLPSATGTLALTSDIPSVSGYVPYTGATQSVNLGYNQLLASTLSINGDSPTGGSYLGFKHSTSVNTGNNGYTSIYTFGTNTIGFKSISGATTKDFSFSMASITPGVPGGRIYTLPDADGTLALTSQIPANPVGGTGSAGQVTYWSSSSAITGESNLFWDATNDRLGIGTATPATPLHISTSGLPLIRITAGSESRVHNINAVNNGRDLSVLPFRNFSIITGNGIAEGLIVLNSYEDFIVGTGSSYTSRFQIFTDGNVSISNSPSNAGYKLDVNGTGRFSGALTGTSATFSTDLTLTNSSFSLLKFINTTAANTWNMFAFSDGTFNLGISGVGNFLALSSTGAATFSGDVTISKTSPTFRLTRGTTSASSLLVYNTNGTDNWLVGTGVTGSNTDYRVYNNSLGADAIYVVNSNNNVLIGTTTDNGNKLQVNNIKPLSLSGGGVTKQHLVNSKTAASSGTSLKLFYVGFSHSVRLYLYILQDSNNIATAIADFTTAYGSPSGGITTSSRIGNISSISASYNNGGSPAYTIDVTVNYSGATPTIYAVIEGISNDSMYLVN